MQRVTKTITLLAWAICFFSFYGCEKDDICVEGDTPLLVIGFYDIENPEVAQEVTALRVVGAEKDTTVNTVVDRTNLSEIAIPLQIGNDTTSYVLISNSASDENDVETGNVDVITFNYVTHEVFVSRACGFVANFDTLAYELPADDDAWIQDVEIVQTLVKDQVSAHVKIYH